MADDADTTLENTLKSLEGTLTASGYTTPARVPGEQRIGSAKAGSDMPDIDPDSEKKEGKKASDGTDFTSQIHKDKTGKQAGDEEEEEDNDEKDAKVAKAAKIAKDAAAKIATLQASVQTLANQLTIEKARPMMGVMLQARAERGMATEDLRKFEQSM